MLVLSRKLGEKIQIGSDVVITVVRVKGGVVRIGIEAAPEIAIRRAELAEHRTQGGTELDTAELTGTVSCSRGGLSACELVTDFCG